MNLSVVMKTIDKMSPVVQKITNVQNKYTKQISKTQSKLKDNTATQAAIADFRKLTSESKKNSDKLKIAQERLSKLNDKRKQGTKLTAAQSIALKKHQATVKKLSHTQKYYGRELSKQQSSLKKRGVNTQKLSAAERILAKEYRQTTSQLDKLNKSYAKRQKLSKFVQKAQTFTKPSMGKAKAGGLAILGLAAPATAFFAVINKSAAELDKLAKSASNLKMPVSELQALRSQAGHAGVATDSLDKAMFRFTKRFGVLQETGSGAFGSFLKKGKNPLFEELKNAESTQVAYTKLLKAFGKLKTNQQQMAFADAAFGQDGRKMLIMLRQGTQGLTSAKKELHELGAIVGKEDTDAAQNYNDALQKIQEIWNGLKHKALTPVIQKLTKTFTAFIGKYKKADYREKTLKKLKAVIEDIYTGFKAFGKGIMFVIKYFPELMAGLAAFKVAMIVLNAVLLANPIGLVIAGISALAIAGVYMAMRWKSVIKEWKNFIEMLKVFKDMFKALGMVISAFADRSKHAFYSFLQTIKRALIAPIITLFRLLNKIPKQLLPESWGEGIAKTTAYLDSLDNKYKAIEQQQARLAGKKGKTLRQHFEVVTRERHVSEQQIKLAKAKKPQLIEQQIKLTKAKKPLLDLAGEFKQNQNLNVATKNTTEMLIKSPEFKSSSTVDIRILSDKPTEIVDVKSDRNNEVNVNTGSLFDLAY